MSAEQLRRYIGCRVVDERGHPLGRVVGITHHGDGGASALVSGGPWPWSDGLQVPLDGAATAGGLLRVRPTADLSPAPLATADRAQGSG
jgi:hypothetical protein